MSDSWSFGYSDYICEDGLVDVHLGTASTFAEAVSELYDNVEKMAADAESYQSEHFVQVLADIRLIKDDLFGIWADPDQWEDMTFHDEIGEIEYYVVQD
jgi:hypothetical protein